MSKSQHYNSFSVVQFSKACSSIVIPFFLFLDKFPVAGVLAKAAAYSLEHPELNWVMWLVCFGDAYCRHIQNCTVYQQVQSLALCRAVFLYLAGYCK